MVRLGHVIRLNAFANASLTAIAGDYLVAILGSVDDNQFCFCRSHRTSGTKPEQRRRRVTTRRTGSRRSGHRRTDLFAFIFLVVESNLFEPFANYGQNPFGFIQFNPANGENPRFFCRRAFWEPLLFPSLGSCKQNSRRGCASDPRRRSGRRQLLI
jgi:hypothetical protein